MNKKNLLLIVTGSVATIKFIELSKRLEKSGFSVKIATTPSAKWFIINTIFRSPGSIFYFLKRWRPIFLETIDFIILKKGKVKHIALAKWADLILVAPASANTLAKITFGITDNFALSLIRAMPKGKKVLLAPAMNTSMWDDPAIVKSIEAIKEFPFNRKYVIIPPIFKELFCGDKGKGAMAEIEKIVKEAKSAVSFD